MYISFEHYDTYLLIVLEAIALDIVLSLFPVIRDRLPPLGGIPAYVFLPFVKKLNRKERGNSVLLFRGFFVLVTAIGFALVAGLLITRFISPLPYGSLVTVMLVFSCLSLSRPWRVIPSLRYKVKAGDATAIQQGVTLLTRHRSDSFRLLGRKPDAHALARAGVTDMAAGISRGLVAPIFWYLIPLLSGHSEAGMLALFVYVIVAELRRIILHHKYDTFFEKPIGFVDEVLHYVPARLAAMVIWLAALFAPSANPAKAVICVWKQASLARSSAMGWLLASFAGGLHIALSADPKGVAWIGPDKASARVNDIDMMRAFWLYNLALLLVFGILVVLLYHALADLPITLSTK